MQRNQKNHNSLRDALLSTCNTHSLSTRNMAGDVHLLYKEGNETTAGGMDCVIM
jgi:hypothetical protein